MAEVNKQAFINWMKNPVTQIIMGFMHEDREVCIQNIANERFMANPFYPQLMAKWSGMVTIYTDWLNLCYEDVDKIEKEAEMEAANE